jgi:uncharacterized protein (DUF58 family)
MVLTLALADLLATAGERTGLIGASKAMLTRDAAERIAALIPGAMAKPSRPDTHLLRRFTDIVLIGDFLDPIGEIEAMLDDILRAGVHAHLVQVIDPIEETFPYAGRTEFQDPETGLRHVVSRAEQYRIDYQNRLAALRERLVTLCRRLDWTFLVHRTDRPATEPLLALHARLADRHSRATGAAFNGRAA